jgi:hypothetical protein
MNFSTERRFVLTTTEGFGIIEDNVKQKREPDGSRFFALCSSFITEDGVLPADERGDVAEAQDAEPGDFPDAAVPAVWAAQAVLPVAPAGAAAVAGFPDVVCY